MGWVGITCSIDLREHHATASACVNQCSGNGVCGPGNACICLEGYGAADCSRNLRDERARRAGAPSVPADARAAVEAAAGATPWWDQSESARAARASAMPHMQHALVTPRK